MVRAEVSTSQAASPAAIRRAVASRATASPGTVCVTAARSISAPARSSAEAIRSRSLTRGSSTTRPASGASAASWGRAEECLSGLLREVDSAMAAVPPRFAGMQVDDIAGTVLQQDLGHSDSQRLRRPNRRCGLTRAAGAARCPGQLGAQLAADFLAAVERGDHRSQHEHPRRAARRRSAVRLSIPSTSVRSSVVTAGPLAHVGPARGGSV